MASNVHHRWTLGILASVWVWGGLAAGQGPQVGETVDRLIKTEVDTHSSKRQSGGLMSDPPCHTWQANWPPLKPSAVLLELSGMVRSTQYPETLFHVMDSGHAPILYVTNFKGEIRKEVRYRLLAWDVEALSRGPCPWGGTCLYAADTGDNLHLRTVERIDVIDEKSIFGPPLRTAHIMFRLPGDQALDIEAIAVSPLDGDLFLFSKEQHRSQVFRLPFSGWKSPQVEHSAQYVGALKLAMVTDATWSEDGTRLLLATYGGLFERAAKPEGSMQRVGGFLPFERRLPLPILDQQEAVAYLADDRSVIYSSEKKLFRNTRWGLVMVSCITSSHRDEH